MWKRNGEVVNIQHKQFLIENQSPERVMLTFQEFENKYQGFQSRWDFEKMGQQDNTLTFQLVDHAYETPRAKGESDSPIYQVTLEPAGENVSLNLSFHWKRSNRNLSLALLLLLAISRVLVFLLVHGDKVVLFMAIWLFCMILYLAWLLQNYLHDRISQDIFMEILAGNFKKPL